MSDILLDTHVDFRALLGSAVFQLTCVSFLKSRCFQMSSYVFCPLAFSTHLNVLCLLFVRSSDYFSICGFIFYIVIYEGKHTISNIPFSSITRMFFVTLNTFTFIC